MWYSNTLQFPFQEIYKEYAQISAQKLCLRRFSMQHQNMVWQDIRRWSKQNQNMGLSSMEASEELEFISRSTEVLMVSRSEALQGQKTRRCSAPSYLTLMIFKRCIHKHQIRSKYKMAGYAD